MAARRTFISSIEGSVRYNNSDIKNTILVRYLLPVRNNKQYRKLKLLNTSTVYDEVFFIHIRSYNDESYQSEELRGLRFASTWVMFQTERLSKYPRCIMIYAVNA